MMMARRRRADYDNNNGGASASEDGIDPLYGADLLTPAEERALFTAYQRTHDAQLRDQLILANTRLVRSLARRYHVSAESGMTTEDLEMEGMFGLMTAIERFDLTRGLKFSTMATHWIKQAIQRAIADQAQLIREPVHVQEKRQKAWRAGGGGDTEALRPSWQMLSLDEPLLPHSDTPEETTLAALIPAPEIGGTVEEIATDRAHWHATLYAALGRLPARERYVLELRYGLHNGGDCWTLEQCGSAMNGISRERVRQIEGKAFTYLRQMLSETSDGELVLRLLTLVKTTTERETTLPVTADEDGGAHRPALSMEPHAVAQRAYKARKRAERVAQGEAPKSRGRPRKARAQQHQQQSTETTLLAS